MSKELKTINEEAGLPDNWIPIDVKPIVPSSPAFTEYPDGTGKYLQGSLPPGFQHDTSFVGTGYRGGTPEHSLMPLGIAGNPTTNAAIQSTANQVAKQVVASTPVAAVTTSSSTDVDIISAVNSGLFGSLDVSSFTAGQTTGGGAADDFVTPSTVGELIISYRMMSNASPAVFSAPWTPLSLSGGAIGTLGWQKVLTTATLHDGFAIAGNEAWAMAMLGLASNATPVFTSLASTTANLPTSAVGVTIAAGVGLLVFVEFAANVLFLPGVSVTDTLGNVYVPVGEAIGIRAAGSQQCQLSVFYCASPSGGVATISLGGNSATVSTTYTILQVTGLTTNAATYTFQSSDATKLVQFRGSANVAGSLPTPALAAGWQAIASNNGSGNVTISSAGPPLNQSGSSIVLQPGTFIWIFSDGTNYWSTSAAVFPSLASPAAHKFLTSYDPLSGKFNSAQPSLADLTNGTTGTGTTVVLQNSATLTGVVNLPTITIASTISNYNGIGTVSNGIAAEYAAVDLTAQTAAKATTTLYAVTGAGQFRLNWNAKVTTVAGTSSTLGPLTIVYTDPDGVVQTITCAAHSNAGVTETSDTGNTTTTVLLGVPVLLNCKGATNVTYAFAYASNAAATMAYNLHIRLEAL